MIGRNSNAEVYCLGFAIVARTSGSASAIVLTSDNS